MICLKCGREMEEGNAFCDRCLTEMAKHPVRPNTVVVLPSRPRILSKKAGMNRHPEKSQRELLQKARRRCRRLAIATAVLSVLLAAAIAAGAWLVLRPKQAPTGQNYKTVTSSSPAGIRGS